MVSSSQVTSTSHRGSEAPSTARALSRCLGSSACRHAILLALALLIGGCAARTPPPLPTALRYADYLYPTVPQGLQGTPGTERVDAGWRYLQNDDLRNASREFSEALERSPALYPAHTGAGYVALAQRNFDRATAAFDAALRTAPRYVPALVGRGQALLALERDADALAAFETALKEDPSLTELARRVEVLRFRSLQDVIAAARTAAEAGRLPDARLAYERTLKATPDSAFLHRELGTVERTAGNADAALDHFRRAAALDPFDAVSLVQAGELLEARQDYVGAEAAYRKAAAIEATPELSARIAAVVEKAREATLPPEFAAIASSREITRGQLAALIGVRLEPLLRDVPPRQVVMTDIGGHWAARWINQVARAGIIEPFENHTFQPRAGVRRGDLAAAVTRLLTLLTPARPELRATLVQLPQITDLSRTHLSYPAASVAAASGVLPLLDGGRFEVGRAVSGAEATEAVARLQALAREPR